MKWECWGYGSSMAWACKQKTNGHIVLLMDSEMHFISNGEYEALSKTGAVLKPNPYFIRQCVKK